MARKTKQTFDTEKEPFPTALREMMTKKGITQTELSENIGVTRQAISLYATGQSTPDIKTFEKIVRYFGVSADYMLGISEVKSLSTDVKAIHNYTGLDEESIEYLNDVKWYMKDVINVIDVLIKNVKYSSKRIPIANLISQYFTFQVHGSLKHYSMDSDGVITPYKPDIINGTAYTSPASLTITPEILEKTLLLEIESALIELKGKIKIKYETNND